MLAYAEGRAVSFSRRNDYYTGLVRYHGPAYTFSRVLKAVSDLASLGLITEERSSPRHRGIQSRLRPTSKLVESWHKMPVLFDPHEIIRLKDQEGRLVDYRETDNTRCMRRALMRLNADLATFSLELPAPDVIRTPSHLQIEGQLYRTGTPTLFRVFNRGSFRKGGRAYGWWQSLPKARRLQLLLNGEPTAEPDFIQMHAAMLYAERDLTLIGDAYSVDGFPRELAKIAFQVLVNANSRPGAISALTNKDGWPLNQSDTAGLVVALAHQHRPIADALHVDRGIDLMRIDSRIIIKVLTRCLRAGIPALPIHDSMLTARRHQGRVAEFMEQSAAQELKALGACRVRVYDAVGSTNAAAGPYLSSTSVRQKGHFANN